MTPYLAIVDSDEEALNHPIAITAASLGAPDPELFYERLKKFFSTPPNQQYLYSYELLLSDPILEKVARSFFQETYASFGGYRDNLMGLENQFKNVLYMLEHASTFIAEVSNPKRAIIVGAGPSLDLLLEDLRRVDGFIICVDAAYKKLLEKGIYPDLVVTSERTPDTAPFFELPSLNTAVLANMVSHPDTLDNLQVQPYVHFYTRAFPETDWLELGIEPLMTTPFVTQTAVTFALKHRFKEIVFVGQDFAYGPRGESHANIGHPHIESIVKSYIEAEGVTGSPVKTSFHLNMFAEDLERLISTTKGVGYFNTSPFGRKIQGAEPITLDKIGFRSLKLNDIVSYRIPIRPNYLKEKAQVALEEIKRVDKLDPQRLCDFPHFSELGYSFMIQPFVVYLSQCFMDPDNKETHLSYFQATADQVRSDLIRILEEFIEGIAKWTE